MSGRPSQLAFPTLIAMLLAVTVLIVTKPATAADEMTWSKPHFRYDGKDRRLATVLKKFAQTEHLQISIAAGIDGQVADKLDMPAQRVLDTLAEQHRFTWRLAGKRLHIEKLPAGMNGGVVPGASDTQQGAGDAATVATSPAMPPAEPPLQVWNTTPADRTLQNALARWSLTAGWQLIWELPQDFSIEAAASIKGSFEDAVTAVANSLQIGETPVTAIFFEGNRVLRIVAKGVQ